MGQCLLTPTQGYGHLQQAFFHRDDFYTKSDIVDAFSHCVATVVKRYSHETAVLGTPLSITYCCGRTHFISWLGARQRPTLFLGSFCVGELLTSTNTKWTATTARVVKDNNPNQLVSVGQYVCDLVWHGQLLMPLLPIGDGGFYCVGCPSSTHGSLTSTMSLTRSLPTIRARRSHANRRTDDMGT